MRGGYDSNSLIITCMVIDTFEIHVEVNVGGAITWDFCLLW